MFFRYLSYFFKIDEDLAKKLRGEVNVFLLIAFHLTSTGNNLANSQSIFKKLERFGIEFKFPKIWDQPQLSSLIRSEVVMKNVSFSRFWNHQKMLKASRKQTSTSGGYNSIKSSSISKKYMRYRKEISFPVIWEQPERSSSFR